MIVFLAEVAFFARNIYVKSAGTEDASTEVAGIRAACIKDAYIEDTSNCTGGIFIEPWGAAIRDNFIGNICVKYADSISVVKRLKIYL